MSKAKSKLLAMVAEWSPPIKIKGAISRARVTDCYLVDARVGSPDGKYLDLEPGIYAVIGADARMIVAVRLGSDAWRCYPRAVFEGMVHIDMLRRMDALEPQQEEPASKAKAT